MPRRGNVAKRDVLPDPMYNSKLVTRLINNIMYDGKKGVAQKIVYEAFEIVVLAVRTIRFRSRFVRRDVRPWVCAGWRAIPDFVLKRR